jgi:hypothetical protein
VRAEAGSGGQEVDDQPVHHVRAFEVEEVTRPGHDLDPAALTEERL